jgi:hypothetical protein
MEEEFSSNHSTLGRYFLDWFQKFENSIDGSDSWFETSGRGLTEYWECKGNLLLSWKSGGYRKVLDLLMVRPYFVGFEVLTAANMKMAVFWVVAHCVVWWKFADVSEVLAASIIRAIITLMMTAILKTLFV